MARGLAGESDPVSVLSAGDGNINFVRRVRVGTRSLVVKQARETLERFPEYRVTTERIVFEQRYGEVVAEHVGEFAKLLPRSLDFDADARVRVMEDLGAGPRLDEELARGRVPIAALRELGRFLGAVHTATRPLAAGLCARFANDEMRALHGEHIFALPYQENDFPISDELRGRARAVLATPGLRERIAALRERYYESAEVLVHADVQAGNVLLQGDLPRLLDAEIAHVGDPAFDLGAALAHVELFVPLECASPDHARGADALLGGYREAGGRAADGDRARSYAGVEIMRRAIGAARLPVLAGDAAAAAALEHGAGLVQWHPGPSSATRGEARP